MSVSSEKFRVDTLRMVKYVVTSVTNGKTAKNIHFAIKTFNYGSMFFNLMRCAKSFFVKLYKNHIRTFSYFSFYYKFRQLTYHFTFTTNK